VSELSPNIGIQDDFEFLETPPFEVELGPVKSKTLTRQEMCEMLDQLESSLDRTGGVTTEIFGHLSAVKAFLQKPC